MSKIYEALQQAEKDRVAATGKAASTIEPAPFAEPVQETSLLTGTLPNDEPTEALDSADVAAMLPDIDLSKVIVSEWTPSLPQLPALQDRGKSVEQFRSLRSRMHEFRDLNTLKSILVSSGLPQEGKSFTAVNLAISFARHKASRVLLIDGDMRRSSLHHLLGAPSVPGLAEYLASTADVSEIIHRAKAPENGPPLHHGLASLSFIGAGRDSDKAADLSGNYRFDHLIKTLSPHFDWIVVDSSPVNLVADGVNLARSCDGVLLIARAGITKFEVAQRALTELKASNVVGFVLNAVTKPMVIGGYYGYGYDSYDSYETYDTRSPREVPKETPKDATRE